MVALWDDYFFPSPLDMTRYQQGVHDLEQTEVEPAELVKEAVEEIRAVAVEAGIKIEVEIGDNLPTICVDRAKIVHALRNILSNAVNHSERDMKVTIGVDRSESGNGVEFFVSDQGPGIPAEYHERIFDKFFRVPGQKRDGVGLGLSIVKQFVDAHQGRVRVEELVTGTCMRFVVPR